MPDRSEHSMTVYMDGRKTDVDSIVYQVDHERITTVGGIRPDPSWHVSDSSGHEHRFVLDDKGELFLPTLIERSFDVPCETCPSDECKGTRQITYTCSLCGEKIKPNWVVDLTTTMGREIQTERFYELAVWTDTPPPQYCTIRIESEALNVFGLAWMDETSGLYDGARQRTVYKANLYPIP